jgi:DNA replication protein DnaC
MELVEGKGARRCRCRKAALIAERLTRIPPRYRGVNLDNLVAKPDLHPKQRMAVELIRNNPKDSFVICGAYGTGKTHLLWALYEHAAHDLQRELVVCTMLELIEQYYEAFRPNRDPEKEQHVMVRPNDLMQSRIPYSLFFDDIDKPKITEYVAAQTHALFDAAYNNKHQIICTTNLTPDRLKEHFEKADERYGGAIVRRIVHSENNLIELF